ncbi:MAG: DNA mismatch repair protein MutS [Chlamydiae bacterium]|nr:DNA mismatch repair protein MutS [Chlamydiota bacterium]
MIIKPKLSPMMAQWYACKKRAKDALLLFRLGDFYEAFHEDAILLSEATGVTLTKRQGVPMSGVPAHVCEGYIQKLVAKGFLVAIAEQVEDPKKTTGLVKREVVKVISPGTILSSLPEKANNFLACITQLNQTFALALLDISTGELRVIELKSEKELQDELQRRHPSEILVSEKRVYPFLEEMKKQLSFRITRREAWHFDHQSCTATLTRHFKLGSLDGFGLQGMGAAINAAGVLLSYVQDELGLSTTHIKQIQRDELSSYISIDRMTQRNLELTEPLNANSEGFTLLRLLDRTKTPMGARLFKSWVIHPLLSASEITRRQDGVEELMEHLSLSTSLRSIRDLERLIMRISSGHATPRDLTGLRSSLERIPEIISALSSLNSPLIKEIKGALLDPSPIAAKIAGVLVDDPPMKWGESQVIRQKVDAELDELRFLKSESQMWLANYQAELRESCGIRTLRIIFSKGFGYCIEVSRSQADKMPLTFKRRQTLVNNERFISPELKAYEEKILTAEEKIQAIELRLYHQLREEIAREIEPIKSIARSIATLDSLLSLAEVALQNRYCRPLVNESDLIDIQVGRHPIIEASLIDEPFIPNSTLMGRERFLLITGPNMAGKSTYIRQVALITIMAQMGSFVPAKSATIGIVDKVFSRIGASDDLARGQSTFMVEMTETANILNNATPRSLVILDEIGRGTSTYDGISIAWSVAEFLQKKGCKTLFATHYFELTQLEGIKNISVAVQESADSIIFLRKIVEGSTDKSYGIHVARLAGLPQSVLSRARALLLQLESKALTLDERVEKRDQEQLTLFEKSDVKSKGDSLSREIEALDLNQMTPMQALEQLAEWQSRPK